jgi:hypothetical protein
MLRGGIRHMLRIVRMMRGVGSASVVLEVPEAQRLASVPAGLENVGWSASLL